MKDYSMFINGFITKYIIEKNEILVYTANIKEPQRIPATKENIKYYEQRLEKQYELVIKHQDEIIEYNKHIRKPLKMFLNSLSIVIQLMLFILFGTCLLTQISLGTIIIINLITDYITNKKNKKFKKELKQYETFIEQRKQIEKTAEKDKNITIYLNQETLSKIEENKKLKQNGLIESIYNIDLMDKISLEELKKILLRYKITKSLTEQQTFKIPRNYIQNEEQELLKPKKRALTKPKEIYEEED